MVLKIGIISSSMETIKLITKLAKSMLDEKTHVFISCLYQETNEVKEILLKHKNEIDGWIFSGPNPYTAAKPYLGDTDNTVFCSVTGNEIYHCLLEMIYRMDQKKLRVSIDTPTTDVFAFSECVEQLDIPKNEIYLQDYTVPYDTDDIIKKHLTLWKAGKIDVVLTTLNIVTKKLLEKKIPVRRVAVSTTAMRQAIDMLEQKLTGLHFKESQVGMEIIEIRDYEGSIEKTGNYYKMQKLELRIKNRLLDLCQNLNGYLSEKGNGYYEIFASRGVIKRNIKELNEIIDKIKIDMQLSIGTGIGFASTVFGAQLNARKALVQGRNVDKNIVVLDEDGTFIEDVGLETEFIYQAVTSEPQMTAMLKNANVGIHSYNRIAFIIHKMKWDTFTAAQVAQQLNVTDRNIQRILLGLSKAGLIVEAGQEATSKRGRPTRVYRMK